jgi:coenzyme F420-0:L-glutamate ligase/coenzyme F420-1:gamma-L-glutamate ligase
MKLARIVATALPGIPLIQEGDDLVQIIIDGLEQAGLHLENGDILVIAQKVVSKAEGRAVRLPEVRPTERALELAEVTGKDPRFIQVVLDESREVLRLRRGLIIVEQNLGLICANAGVDRSNAGPGDEVVIRLPLDPDASAQRIREGLRRQTKAEVAVIINDTHGRPWREGAVGVAIGVAGLSPVKDLRGKRDLFGYTLQTTTVGLADQVASAASLLMGQADEGRPIILLRGVPYRPGKGCSRDLLRARETDLFR